MTQTIATIEIAIEQPSQPVATLKASLQVTGKTAYTVLLSKPIGRTETVKLECDSKEPATAWMVQRLKQLVDEFTPNTATVRVIEDTLNLLPKITYRCSNPRCQAKLFESWGTANGIRIVCRKCKTLGIPQKEEHRHA